MDAETKKTITEKAHKLLSTDYHCSEGILIAVGGYYLKDLMPQALRMTTPFAGGIGRAHTDVCGALSGGLMVIGGLYGRTDSATNDDHCLQLACKYREAFIETFGYRICQDLKDNWTNKPGQESCKELVAKASGLLIDILEAA